MRWVVVCILLVTSTAHADSDRGQAPGNALVYETPFYSLSFNTGGLYLDSATGQDPEDTVYGNLYVDIPERRASLYLLAKSNQLVLRGDFRSRRLRVRLAAGDRGSFFLRLDSNIALSGKPEVDARLLLAVAGRRLRLALPTVRVVPKFRGGMLQMEYWLPVVRGRF